MRDVKKTPKRAIKSNKIIAPPRTQKNSTKFLNDYFLIVFEVKCKTIH